MLYMHMSQQYKHQQIYMYLEHQLFYQMYYNIVD